MLRCAAVAIVLSLPSAAAASATDEGPAYVRANARLARTVPHYPRARLLVEEAIGGEIGPVPFEAVSRISRLARPQTQRAVIRFYSSKLGSAWRQRGTACLVSRRRLVVALVNTRRRRLGLLVDSRGSTRCAHLTGMIGDLLDVGYPD